MKARWLVGGLIVIAAALAVLTLRGLREPTGAATRTPAGASGAERAGKATSPAATPGAPEVPPWQASAAPRAGELLPGTVPVSAVNPPPPDPDAPMPPPPVEPPNPALHRPPMDNPGGVDGDRPPRPVPGVE